MKNIFKKNGLTVVVIGIFIISVSLFSGPSTILAQTANFWTQNALNVLSTNTSGGLATADIHVAHCYIGTGTGTPCGGGSGSNPGGNNTDVQFNNSGAFGGSDNFKWDNAVQKLIISGTIGAADGTNSIYPDSRFLSDDAGNSSIAWEARQADSPTGLTLADWSGSVFLMPLGADVNNMAITKVLDPVNPQDAATKNYVDTHSAANLTGAVTSVGTVTSLGSFTSANLASALTNETGSGSAVFASSPTLTTPTLGAATATSINKVTITQPATGSTLTIADGKTLTVSNSLTLAGTDATMMTFPTTSATIARTDAANTFTGHQTIEGVTSTGATGTGNLVFSASPTFTGTVNTATLSATTINATTVATTTGATQTLGNSNSTQTVNLGIGATTNTMTQTVNIGTGSTASGGTKVVHIADGGLTGSTTTLSIGTDPSTGGSSTTTMNGSTVFTSGIQLPKTITAAGTNGAQTINKVSGSVNFAISAGSLVVTDNQVTTTSVLICTVATNDALFTSAQCVAGSGSFTIFANNAPAAATRVNFLITN